MVSLPVEPLALYRPRDPRASALWRLMDRHFDAFQRVYDERFRPKYGSGSPRRHGRRPPSTIGSLNRTAMRNARQALPTSRGN